MTTEVIISQGKRADPPTMGAATVEDVIQRLGLHPHPEGGFYRETFRSAETNGEGMAHGTAIYYAVGKDQGLVWHRIRGKDEVWHFYAGDPVEVRLAAPDGSALDDGPLGRRVFGPDVFGGQEPQLLIPASHWQSARCLGEWTLFGCTVSPGFDFKDFELAPEGWEPHKVNDERR